MDNSSVAVFRKHDDLYTFELSLSCKAVIGKEIMSDIS